MTQRDPTRVVNSQKKKKKEDVKQKQHGSTFANRTENRPGRISLTTVLCFRRVGGKMSGSSMELDGCGQQGFGESPVSSPRGLGSASLPTASTDSLASEEHLLSDGLAFDSLHFLSFAFLDRLLTL